MRSLLVPSILLVATTTAHAMGTDVYTDPVAWNADGTAVLLETSTDRDQDKTTSYTIMSAATAQPVTVNLSQTTHNNGHDDELLLVADCTKAAQQLAKAVTAASFSGVVVHPEACKADRGAIVTIAASQQQLVEQGWVALPQGRPPTAREQGALDALAIAEPNLQVMAPSERGNGKICEGVDVASSSGKLVIVVSRFVCGNPSRTRVRAYAPGKSGIISRGEA